MPSKVLSARRAGTAACHHRCVTTTINNAASSRSRSSSLDPSLLQTLAPSSLPCYALFSPNTALAGACRLPPLALNMDNIDTIDDRRAHRTTLLAPEPRPCVPRADYRRRHAGARRRGAPERQPAVMWERSDERRTQHHRLRPPAPPCVLPYDACRAPDIPVPVPRFIEIRARTLYIRGRMVCASGYPLFTGKLQRSTLIISGEQ